MLPPCFLFHIFKYKRLERPTFLLWCAKSASSERSLSSVWYFRGQPVIEAFLVCGLKRACASPWMCWLLFVALRGPYLTLLPNFKGWDIIFTDLGAARVRRAEVLILLCQHKLRCSSSPAGTVGSCKVQASAGVDLTSTWMLLKALSVEQCGWCCCLWVGLKVLLCEPRLPYTHHLPHLVQMPMLLRSAHTVRTESVVLGWCR